MTASCAEFDPTRLQTASIKFNHYSANYRANGCDKSRPFPDRTHEVRQYLRSRSIYFFENGTSGKIGGSITSSDSSASSFGFTSCPPGLTRRTITKMTASGRHREKPTLAVVSHRSLSVTSVLLNPNRFNALAIVLRIEDFLQIGQEQRTVEHLQFVNNRGAPSLRASAFADVDGEAAV